MTKEVAEFWDSKDEKTQMEIIKVIAKEADLTISNFSVNVSFVKLPMSQQTKLKKYYNEVIKPQLKKQQIVYDGIIEEELPKQIVCPKCGISGVKQTFSKRGVHFLCTKCGWDSNKIFDLLDRESKIKQCAEELKRLFSKLSFVVNTAYAPDSYLTGRLAERSKNYDLRCYSMGILIARIRIEVDRHIDRKKFMTAEECYVIGRPEVVDYLSKANKDGIVGHYLVDETTHRIAMSRARVIKKNCSLIKDRFQNDQYHIPINLRPLVVTFDVGEMEDLLFKGFHRKLYRNAQIW